MALLDTHAECKRMRQVAALHDYLSRLCVSLAPSISSSLNWWEAGMISENGSILAITQQQFRRDSVCFRLSLSLSRSPGQARTIKRNQCGRCSTNRRASG